MEKLIQQFNQVGERIMAQLAAEYGKNASYVSEAQLQRFKRDMQRRWLKTCNPVYSVLVSCCEVEETNRIFAGDLAWLELQKNNDLKLVGFAESELGDREPVFSGVTL
ncbi:hypothetical protein G6162_001527 [Salmonella enterica]|uniref:Uncharacterized protein n=1 Tax=Salmonella enterica subsp. arizonae serovar 48:z4,z24:- TaxID=1967584 RepID=A0A738X789_SALER|nr:hypothetical protein [Salmonella enterica]EAN8610394.1 hypothetical protein [Salmonella enterica subsp. arizonae serovar 48:z4,z24:-]EAT8889921.1 hypothetical protein [Salmonella enterica subsp. arizonae serovar 53:z4,z23,z32:-]ECF5976311.1 hypothetical protein [Salmonella enterica subsp. arizonae]ECP3268745.1 hypothetical protein [Salmonella enterica subsp. enterica serovar [1],13,23:g,z51:-]EDO6343572.1 hypothetical protein [Salmonella enterica subsp. houtenae serovar 48:g,z51:-]EDU81745